MYITKSVHKSFCIQIIHKNELIPAFYKENPFNHISYVHNKCTNLTIPQNSQRVKILGEGYCAK